MRRHAKILVAFLLSLMVVYLGAGVSVVTCTHDQSVEVVQLSELGHKKMGCMENSPCMSVNVLQLSPSSVAQHLIFHFSDLFSVVALFDDILSYWSCSQWEQTLTHYIPRACFNPPRKYLSLIRILII
jgi:hypothetical protein